MTLLVKTDITDMQVLGVSETACSICTVLSWTQIMPSACAFDACKNFMHNRQCVITEWDMRPKKHMIGYLRLQYTAVRFSVYAINPVDRKSYLSTFGCESKSVKVSCKRRRSFSAGKERGVKLYVFSIHSDAAQYSPQWRLAHALTAVSAISSPRCKVQHD